LQGKGFAGERPLEFARRGKRNACPKGGSYQQRKGRTLEGRKGGETYFSELLLGKSAFDGRRSNLVTLPFFFLKILQEKVVLIPRVPPRKNRWKLLRRSSGKRDLHISREKMHYSATTSEKFRTLIIIREVGSFMESAVWAS